jgi:hypothetical protein
VSFLTIFRHIYCQFIVNEISQSMILAERRVHHSSARYYGTYFKAISDDLARDTQYSVIEKYTAKSIDTLNQPMTDAVHARRFATALWQSACKRKYCVTSKGDIGLMPKYTSLGDFCHLANPGYHKWYSDVCASGRVLHSWHYAVNKSKYG